MGFRAIGRVLGVGDVAVLNGARKAGEWLKSYHQSQRPFKQIDRIELDEMWHVIVSKQENYGLGLHWAEDGSVYLMLSQEAVKQVLNKGYGKPQRNKLQTV